MARRLLWASLAVAPAAVLLFLVPSIPGWHGNPDRHSLAVLTLPVSIVLLGIYLAVTLHGLRRHRRLHAEADAEPAAAGWSLSTALVALALATGATALVS